MIHAQDNITKLMITPVSCTAGMTAVGFIDTLGADYAEVSMGVSDIATTGTASATGGSLSLGHSDDTNPSNVVTIVANVTGFKFARLREDKVDCKTLKRYLFATFTAGTAGVSNETQLVSCIGKVSRLAQSPTSTGGMVTGLSNSAARITSV